MNVESITEEVIMGVERKIINLSENGHYMGKWIEGIGSTDLDNTITRRGIPSDGSSRVLWECTVNGECIFSFRDYTGIDNITELNEEGDNRSMLYFDLRGNQVIQPQKGEIYIHNRQKIIY